MARTKGRLSNEKRLKRKRECEKRRRENIKKKKKCRKIESTERQKA